MTDIPEPLASTHYCVQMICNGIRFILPQHEGERLCEVLATRTMDDKEQAFFRCEDLAGCDTVLQVLHIEAVWFTSPATREWDRVWNTEAKKDKDWSEPE